MKTILSFLLAIVALTLSLALLVYFVYNFAFDFSQFDGERITDFGLKNESLLVINLGLLFFVLSKRTVLSLLLTSLIYVLFLLTNLEKIKFFNSTVMPQDLKYVDQLLLIWPIFKPYLMVAIVVATIVVFLVCVFIKKEPPVKLLTQLGYLKKSILFACLFFTSIQLSGLLGSLQWLASYERSRAHMISTSEKYGLLTIFFRNMLHLSSNKPPESYSKETINELTLHKIYPPSDLHISNEEPVNLIIYLIESFTDPAELGIKTTHDPIPFFHELKNNHDSGFVYSPEIGGRSANAEFEILTGFSKHFFSHSSIPFIDLPFREIPSIGNELKQNGYFTKVIQGSDLGFFNYVNAYKMLGFDEIVSLKNKKNVMLDKAGRYPADSSLVAELIESSKMGTPFFLYAFTNSTHGPWKYKAYNNSDLNLSFSQPLNSKVGEQQLRTYVNALSQADKALEKLIKHFENRNEKTLILILGDHQPGIPEVREQYMFKLFPNKFDRTDRKKLRKQFNKFDRQFPLESYQTMHKTPFVLWSNYAQKSTDSSTIGMNELSIKVFKMLGHKPKYSFYYFLNQFSQHAEYSDILKYVYLPDIGANNDIAQWVKAYELLQYDILLGKNYLSELFGK